MISTFAEWVRGVRAPWEPPLPAVDLRVPTAPGWAASVHGMARRLGRPGVLADVEASYGLPRVDGDPSRLAGKWEGAAIGVALELGRGPPGAIRVTRDLRRPLPIGGQVTRKWRGSFGWRAPRDVVLSHLLVLRGVDVDAVEARLADDRVRGPLLELADGSLRFLLTADRLAVALDTRRYRPVDAVDRVVEVEALISACT